MDNNNTQTTRGTYNKASTETRRRVIHESEIGGDWKAVALANGVLYKTAYHWVSSGEVEPRPRGGRRFVKITNDIIETILNWLEENCQLTLKTICERVFVTFNVTVTNTTISKHLEGRLFTSKLTHYLPDRINTPENKEARKIYVERIIQYVALQKFIIFVDETNFNLLCRRKVGRSRRGNRAVVNLPNSKGPNLHIIGAISSTKLEFWERKRGAFKKNDFQNWLRRCLSHCIENGNLASNIVVVLDNAPVHSRVEILSEEKEFAGVEFCRLSPYSPMFNPIEHCWSSFKSGVKNYLQEHRETLINEHQNEGLTQTEFRLRFLENCADNEIIKITPQTCLHSYNHVQRYYPIAMQRTDVTLNDDI